jgi:hypothetical protein
MNVSLSSAARSCSFAWNGIIAAASATHAPITTHRERGPAAYVATRLSIAGGHYRNPALAGAGAAAAQGLTGGAGGV